MAPWWWFPCKPKQVGAVLLILKCFNSSTFFNVVCISWKLKCWILLMHGVIMKLKPPVYYIITNQQKSIFKEIFKCNWYPSLHYHVYLIQLYFSSYLKITSNLPKAIIIMKNVAVGPAIKLKLTIRLHFGNLQHNITHLQTWWFFTVWKLRYRFNRWALTYLTFVFSRSARTSRSFLN